MELEKLAEDTVALLMSNTSTDLWTAMKNQLSRLLSGSQPRRLARIEQQIDQLRQDLASAPERQDNRPSNDYLAGLWQGRILAALEDHPEAAGELAGLVASYKIGEPAPRLQVSISDIHASGNASQIIVGQGDLTLEHPAATRHRPPQPGNEIESSGDA